MMSGNRSRERRRIHEVLQDAADQLTAGLPDPLRIGVTDEEIMYDCTTWSSALTRRHFSGETARRMLSVDEWRTEAQDQIDELFGPAIASQRDRWASAEALGLTRGGAMADRPPEEMMVDRVLLGMLGASGINARRVAAHIGRCDTLTMLQSADAVARLDLGGRHFFARHEGVGPPTICTSITVGGADYDGSRLTVEGRAPESIVLASIGRSLGSMVSTGIADLDRRPVVDASAHRDQHSRDRLTFELAPDLVRIGAI